MIWRTEKFSIEIYLIMEMNHNFMTMQYQLQQSSVQRDRLRRKLKRLQTKLAYEQHFAELQKMYVDFQEKKSNGTNDT